MIDHFNVESTGR